MQIIQQWDTRILTWSFTHPVSPAPATLFPLVGWIGHTFPTAFAPESYRVQTLALSL